MVALEKREALSVSAAMARAKSTLEQLTVTMVGEISEVNSKAGYKAVYFTIKDKEASLPCMIWVNRYQASGVELVVGQLVEITGRFTLYAAKGRMNFDVFAIVIAGEGDLRLQVANLARKLEAEGLMKPDRKLPLPAFPLTIGLVTSPRGAAVHDVLRTLRRRFPLARVVLAGVPVEGRQAAEGIIEGMRCVLRAKAEVILLVRGGGSFEDLMPFNDETLVRAISKCPIPVVTGIGHEPDTSIADMVADMRASTPTAAAEAVSPSQENLQSLLEAKARSLSTNSKRAVERAQNCLSVYESRPVLSDSHMLFAAQAQCLDMIAERLHRAIPLNLERDRIQLQHQYKRLASVLPLAIERQRVVSDLTRERLYVLGATLDVRFRNQIGLAAARLNDLSPLAILGRGYAIARSSRGDVVKSVKHTFPDESLSVVLHDGIVDCQVKQVQEIETDVIEWKGVV